jgi:predicted nucleic acid-binding protein
MARSLYLDSSAILRPVLERGLSPEIEERLAGAEALVTSRLALVETGRAFLRVRQLGGKPEAMVADAERSVRSLWRHCEIWQVTAEVCDLAELVAPRSFLRSLDALHLATYSLARRAIPDLELLTSDDRLRQAAEGA